MEINENIWYEVEELLEDLEGFGKDNQYASAWIMRGLSERAAYILKLFRESLRSGQDKEGQIIEKKYNIEDFDPPLITEIELISGKEYALINKYADNTICLLAGSRALYDRWRKNEQK
ncbi:MAG: hypothetical protein WDA47_03215 [Bacilli bacterium]